MSDNGGLTHGKVWRAEGGTVTTDLVIVPNTSPVRWIGAIPSEAGQDGAESGEVLWEAVALPVVAWRCYGDPLVAEPIPMSNPLVARARCVGALMPDDVVFCGSNRFATLDEYIAFVNEELQPLERLLI